MTKVPDFSTGNLTQIASEVRAFVKSGCHVVFSDHAENRMVERRISRIDVRLVLTVGQAVGTRLVDGDWRTKMEAVIDGRMIGVAIAVTRREDGLVVITVVG